MRDEMEKDEVEKKIRWGKTGYFALAKECFCPGEKVPDV